MYFPFVICLCILFTTVLCARVPRIIGGQNAETGEFPYSVSLRLSFDRHKHFCGGAIISNEHILTAAQCVAGLKKTDFVIYIGRNDAPDYTVPPYNVKKIKMHPRFIGKLESNSRVHNDIAVITTEQFIVFTVNQNQIELPTADVAVGAQAVINGWGMTSYPAGYTAARLQKASMTIVDNNECASNLPFPIYEKNICAVQGPGVGACYGDSGSPLVSNGVLVGIASFVQPCATGRPDVYTRVFSYILFIRSAMSNNSNRLLSVLTLSS